MQQVVRQHALATMGRFHNQPNHNTLCCMELDLKTEIFINNFHTKRDRKKVKCQNY